MKWNLWMVFLVSVSLRAENDVLAPAAERGVDRNQTFAHEWATEYNGIHFYRLGDSRDSDPEVRYLFGWNLPASKRNMAEASKVELVFWTGSRLFDPAFLEIIHLSGASTVDIAPGNREAEGAVVFRLPLGDLRLNSQAKEHRVDVTQLVKEEIRTGSGVLKFRFQLAFNGDNRDGKNDQLLISTGTGIEQKKIPGQSGENGKPTGTRLEIQW